MSFKYQLNRNYWNQSKQIFFTPKLSLEGRNLFPHISQTHHMHHLRDQPFLNILKKPIMSLYDRVQMRSQKKPVCIVGMPKQVQVRHVRTGQIKRVKQETLESTLRKESLSTTTPNQMKTEIDVTHSPSKQILPITNPPPEGSHYYILGVGNNREIIQEILSRRQGWYPTNLASSIFHLRWEQARPKFQNLSAPHKQLINHLPGHQIISDKGNLLSHLKVYCEKNQESLHKIIPVSFILDFSSEQLQEQLKKFITFFVDCANFKDILNPQEQKKIEIKPERNSARKRNTNDQILVIIDSPKRVGRQISKNSAIKITKNRCNDLAGLQLSKRKDEGKIIYKNLISTLKPFYIFQDMSAPKKESPWTIAEPSDIYGQSSLWLLKPSDLNRGRGIKLFRTVEELGQLLKSQLQKHQKGSFIVQKYLERPLLLEGRKFDIRVWALITHHKQIYFFQEGYLRLSSEIFTLDSSSLFTHLTNNAVQKHATNYGQFEEGNILPISYLYQKGHVQKDWLFNQIKRIIVLTIKAGGTKLHTPSQKNHSISVGSNGTNIKQSTQKMKYFQIFGFDFMVDCNKHIWLIQVNTNPCIELSNKWLATIVPRMLDDAFKLTIDRIFPKKKVFKQQKKQYRVDGYQDDSNMWQMLQGDSSDITPPIG